MKHNTIRDWLTHGSSDGKFETAQKEIFYAAMLGSGFQLNQGPVYDDEDDDIAEHSALLFTSPLDDGENYVIRYKNRDIIKASVSRGEWEIQSKVGTWNGMADDWEFTPNEEEY